LLVLVLLGLLRMPVPPPLLPVLLMMELAPSTPDSIDVPGTGASNNYYASVSNVAL